MTILEISQEEAKKSDGIYLDVRRDDERAKGHIENDLHISTKELEDRYEEDQNKEGLENIIKK